MRRFALMLLGGSILLGCRDGTTAPPPPTFAAIGCEPGPPGNPVPPDDPGPLPDVGCRPVASVSISPDAVTLYVGETLQLEASLRDRLGYTITNRAVTWESADATVATVSSTGFATALRAGQVEISATSQGVTAHASVTVVAACDPLVGTWSGRWVVGGSTTWSAMEVQFTDDCGLTPGTIIADVEYVGVCSGYWTFQSVTDAGYRVWETITWRVRPTCPNVQMLLTYDPATGLLVADAVDYPGQFGELYQNP